MNIGSHRKRITFQSQTKTADGMGGYSTVPKNEMTVWAAIWDISANEQIANMQNVMTISCRMQIRYRPGIKPYWRIYEKEQDKYYAINSIINPNRANRYLDLMVKEVAK